MVSTSLASAGEVFQLIRQGTATTRPELGRLTGLSRTAVTQRVIALRELGLVIDNDPDRSTGGRPPGQLIFNADAGVVLAADFEVDRCHLAVSNLDGTTLGELQADIDIGLGPNLVVDWMVERLVELLGNVERCISDVRGIGIGLPGPVEFKAGRVVSPPIMPGWDGVSIPELVWETFAVPVQVDNDVNIMAVGEYATYWRDLVDDLLFVKVSAGIGCGIIVGGRLHRGAQGAAGDVGHIPVDGYPDVICRCGNSSCVEAVASGTAIAARLREAGYDCPDTRAVADLVQAGSADASRLVRDAGRLVGTVIAHLVNSFNPAVIVLGGEIAHAHAHLLAGIREVVYQRSPALATRNLELVVSRLAERAGMIGATTGVLDDILSADSVNAALRSGHTGSPGLYLPGTGQSPPTRTSTLGPHAFEQAAL
jgi:predicted NBD/HSP70 family sugar kinase